MKRAIIFCFFMNYLTGISQIQIGGETEAPIEEKKKEKEQKPEKVKQIQQAEASTEIFIGGNWSMTNRKLVENDNVFGDTLGERAKETGIGEFAYGLGIRSKLHKFLLFEGGISYLKNGESYSFSGVDSSYSYTNNYQFIGMPLKLYFIYGEKKLRFQVGAGVIPQMALKFKQTSKYQTKAGEEVSETLKTKNGYNSFVFSFVANVGIQYKFLPSWSVYLQPEYRLQLSSSYLKTNPYKHFGNAIGVSLGCVLTL